MSFLQMPPRQKKKSVAQKQPPAAQVPDTPFHDPKNFERFKFFSERQIFKPYVLSLDVADHFDIWEEVEDMVALPEWRYLLMEFNEETHSSVLVEVMTTMKLTKFDGLTSSVCVQFHIGHTMFRFSPDNLSDLMGFGPVQQLTEEEKYDRVVNVPNIQQFWEELTDGTTNFRSSHSRSSEFRKREHIFMQYLLGHSITGRFDATSSVNHADLFCLYGMVKRVRHRAPHMGVVIWNLMKNQYYLRGVALYLGPYLTRILRATHRVVLAEPRAPGMEPLTAEAVARMRDKIVPNRARTADMADVTDARREEAAYEANSDAVDPAHVEAGEGSSSTGFQQQVLAQLAAMHMRFDHIDNRLDEMAAANAQSRIEAQAYYEWMRGHYPPQGARHSHLMIPPLWDDVYVVQYKNLVTDDFSAPLTENVPRAEIRPQPQQVQSTFFDLYQEVDAFDNDGWWVGQITGKIGNRYYVYFENTGEEIFITKIVSESILIGFITPQAHFPDAFSATENYLQVSPVAGASAPDQCH
nr:DUF724 domain-containing protein 3 [Ipomoea batatas]